MGSAAPAGLHVNLLWAGPTLRFGVWFERWLDRSAFRRRYSDHLHPGCLPNDPPPPWMVEGVTPRTWRIEASVLSSGYPIALPGPMLGWELGGFRTSGRAVGEGVFDVEGFVVSAAASLAPLRHLIVEWRARFGEGFVSPGALRVAAFADALLGFLRDRPLLPALSLPEAAWEHPSDASAAWLFPAQPLAWVPAVSLSELDALFRELSAVPNLLTQRPERYPSRFARFLVEVLHAATPGAFQPPAGSPWTPERLQRALLKGHPSLVDLHRAHGSCLHPHHPVFRPPIVPPGNLGARVGGGGKDAPPGRPLRLELGIGEGEDWVSLERLEESGALLRGASEEEAHVWFRPGPVLFRDWLAMARDQRALFCRPELLAAGSVAVSEAEAQRVLEGGKVLGEGSDMTTFLELEGVSAHHAPKEFTRFTAAPGRLGEIFVRLAWDMTGDPEEGRAFGHLRFSPRLTLAIGDGEITLEEAAALLASTTSPIVHAHGVALHRQLLEEAIEMARAREKVLEKVILSDGGSGVRWQSLVDLEDRWANDFDDEEAEETFHERWTDFLSSLSGGAGLRSRGTPEGFVGELRPYQARGLAWLCFMVEHGLGGCLADDMGLGKTVQVIALLCERKARFAKGLEEKLPSLVVCPTSVVLNWEREMARFAPGLRVYVHQGHDRAEDAEELERFSSECDVTITSFALARRDEELLQSRAWDAAIIDEAQNIKNPVAQQSRAVRGLTARGRLALTGTPVENHLGDLWALFHFLNPGLLGGATRFAASFSTPIHGGKQRALDRLHRRVGPFLLRRTKRDPEIQKDLPEKQEQDVICELTREQTALYRAMTEAALEGLEDKEGLRRKAHILTAMLRLKQIANHPESYHSERPDDLFGRSGKLDRLVELVDELLEVDEPAILFTQFTDMAVTLRNALEQRFEIEVPIYHGGLTAHEREDLVQAFQAKDGPPLLILSLRAGGTGLNLTRASTVIHYDRWWNPAVEDQATDRAHRIGQERTVNVYRFYTRGTIEERVQAMLAKKRNLADRVLSGADDGWLTELDDESLRMLFALPDDEEANDDDPPLPMPPGFEPPMEAGR